MSTRTVRKLVAVGTWRLSSMYLTSAAAAPRSGMDPVGDCAGEGRAGAFFCSSFAGAISLPPLAGAGTSASTLSVVTSTSPSPSRTWSPGCFSHLAMVPSVTDSPISGRVTCMVDWGTLEFYPLNLGPNMTFKAQLRASEDATASLLCLGLDPEPDLLPPSIERSPAGITQFVRTIVDAVGDSVSSYKLNLAFYERWGREASWLLDQAMAALPKERPVIFDAKRGDVGSTAQAYAHAMFEAWGADAVTVHPWLGYDSVAPFLAHRDKEVFIVCRTSNPGAAEFQHMRSDGEALYRHIARAGVRWDHHDNIAFVVGATAPAEIRDVRQIAGDRLLLIPGIGAQGGELAASLPAALRPDGRGAIIPISRGILFASAGADYADAARAAARRYRDAINALRPEPATARG